MLAVLLVSSYTPLGWGLGSMFHLLHTLRLVLMEQTLTADTGRLSLSSLWYCVAGPQSPHWKGWGFHRQHYWLQINKQKINSTLYVYGVITSKRYGELLWQSCMPSTTLLLEIGCNIYAHCISPLHTRWAGSGVQVPTPDTPSGDVQVALILPVGTNTGLHLKTIWAPPTVLISWMFSIIPFSGARGIPQSTRGRKLMVYNCAEDSPKFITLPQKKSDCLHTKMVC